MPYYKYDIPLTSQQAKKISFNLKNNRPFKILVKRNLINSSNNLVPLLLTQKQINKIEKAKSNKLGVTINISAKQLSVLRKEGEGVGSTVLLALLSGILSASSGIATKKILEKITEKKQTKGGLLLPISIPQYQRNPVTAEGLMPLGYTKRGGCACEIIGNGNGLQTVIPNVRGAGRTRVIKKKKSMAKKKVTHKGRGLFPQGVN